MGQAMEVVFVIVLLGLLSVGRVECRAAVNINSGEYPAMSCRKHSASLIEYGGVGDGKTSNTEAFKKAIADLSKFSSDGGAQLIVPPGKWLIGSFNLTSHFTLYLQKDAVILASQDENDFPLIPVLPSYGRGRDAPGDNLRYNSFIHGNNLTDVILTWMKGNQFTGICISNVNIGLSAKPKELQWNCTDIAGFTSGVTPKPCALLPDKEISCEFYVSPQNFTLIGLDPSFEEGAAVVPQDIIDVGIAEWEEVLIGFFLDKRMRFPFVKNALEKAWKIKGSMDITTDRDLFYISFSIFEDKQAVLEGGPIFIAGKIFVVMPWTPEAESQRNNVSTVPIWAKLSKVRKNYGQRKDYLS
ncbi:hypothetical protein IFM89_012940 [Coptis chinensis]|uniref:DUF4283 domain-containing protein n=1 Tax=Coptis chinensis TaxID=261450 RepID=A0A835LRD3_9MAGN|nr:hypothetical protein IFM89_012940 [Coptis chinensis]